MSPSSTFQESQGQMPTTPLNDEIMLDSPIPMPRESTADSTAEEALPEVAAMMLDSSIVTQAQLEIHGSQMVAMSGRLPDAPASSLAVAYQQWTKEKKTSGSVDSVDASDG